MGRKAKVTQWFGKNAKPVHVGWYQREYNFSWLGGMPDYWDGEKWMVGDGHSGRQRPAKLSLRWRGLAVNPLTKADKTAVTQWFGKSVNPAKVGVYEVIPNYSCIGVQLYAYWDGNKFCWRAETPYAARNARDRLTAAGDRAKWRGLTSAGASA